MSKRIFQIAKDMGMASKSLIERIKDLEIDTSVTNALSTLSDENVQKLKAALAEESSSGSEEQSVAGGVIRRRAPRRRTLGDSKPEKNDADDAPTESDVAANDEEKQPVAEPTQEGADATPTRRRRIVAGESVDDVAPAPKEGDSEPTLADTPDESEAQETAEPVAQEPEAEPEPPKPKRRRRFATVRTRPEEEKPAEDVSGAVVETRTNKIAAPGAEPVVKEEVEAAPVSEETPEKPRRRRFATVVTRHTVDTDDGEETQVAAEEDATQTPEPEVVEAPRARFATVVTNRDAAADDSKRSPVELAEIARREADAASRSRGGAQIVGKVDIDQINQRNERHGGGPGRGPGFGPGRPPESRDARGKDKDARGRRKRGKRGKRVVGSGELYGKFNQGRRRRKNKRKGGGKPVQQTTAAEHKRVVRMEEAIPVSDLARQMGVKGGEIVMKLAFDLGLRGANINTPIDFDTASLIAEQYNHKVEQVGFDMSDYLPTYDNSEDSLLPRAPVVTVMGHVDHGKTSLLDAIRHADKSLAQGEAGGITQHIGAYKVETEDGEICFLDTPGHAAFSALRARGAKATDIVVLVVAGDDGVMPQTVEALNHAREAETPVIVAVTKMDKSSADAQRIKAAFTEHDLISEDIGGDTTFVEVSSKTGAGIDELLESVLLQAQIMELKANPNRKADGVAIESRLDVGRGPIATVLVQGGTLNVGDIIVIGKQQGHVRSMSDEHGNSLDVATPSTPVEITGLSGVPASGEHFYVVEEEKKARAIAEHVAQQNKQAELAVSASSAVHASDESDLASFLPKGDEKELKVIIKADVQGSVEALIQATRDLANDQVSVRVVHSGVGSITESDVNLASSSGASAVLICGFNVKTEQRAASLADQNGVRVLNHGIIYDMLDDVRSLMVGLLDPIFEEEVIGHAEVRMVFQNSRVGAVAGCMITDGIMRRGAQARVLRDDNKVAASTLGSLRHIDTDKRELQAGFECGLSVEGYSEFKPGDIVECYIVHERQAELH